MNKFEYLNWMTTNYNNYNVDRFNTAAPNNYYNSNYWVNQNNNNVYKNNNGMYSAKYY